VLLTRSLPALTLLAGTYACGGGWRRLEDHVRTGRNHPKAMLTGIGHCRLHSELAMP